MESTKRGNRRWLTAAAVLVGAAVAMLVVGVRMASEPPVAKAAERTLSRIEQEAVARFAGSTPYVSLPDGRRLPPSNEAHALQMKVNAYQGILAKESEERDPTFHLKAEAELARRQPMRATIEWLDVTGNREMNFHIEDSSTCALDGKTEITVAVEDIQRHPCLTQGGNFWDAGVQLTVHLTPISNEDPLWRELLYTTKKAMATEAHLAQLAAAQGS